MPLRSGDRGAGAQKSCPPLCGDTVGNHWCPNAMTLGLRTRQTWGQLLTLIIAAKGSRFSPLSLSFHLHRMGRITLTSQGWTGCGRWTQGDGSGPAYGGSADLESLAMAALPAHPTATCPPSSSTSKTVLRSSLESRRGRWPILRRLFRIGPRSTGTETSAVAAVVFPAGVGSRTRRERAQQPCVPRADTGC